MRLGLLGCGRWGRNLLRELLALDAEVFVVDPSHAALAAARALGASGVCADRSELPDVAAIIVATPASTHAEEIEAVLDRNVPIFTEKPFALNLADVQRIVERAGERVFELHVWRHHPAVTALRDLHRSGALGRLRWMRTTRMNWTSPRTDCDAVWTLLPHDLSIVLEITGDLPEVAFAHAERVDDQAVGMIAELRGSYSCFAEVSARHAEKKREIRLHFDGGVAVMPADGAEVFVHEGDGRSERPVTRRIEISGESALALQMHAVLAFLRGGPAPPSNAREALLIATRMHETRRMAGI
jgi:predicted dehydrogenase